MIESTNLTISLINLFSLILGGVAIGLIFRCIKGSTTLYLNYYFFFLICSVISGFCDWIIYNWVRLLVPGISLETTDSIFHVFWDLIGYPSEILALFFLVKALSDMLKIKLSELNNRIYFSLFLLLTILSYVNFYFGTHNNQNILGTTLWNIKIFVIPFIKLSFLAFAYFRSTKINLQELNVSKFILLLFFSFLVWHFLLLAPVSYGVWRHIIIFTYYFALFLPTLYLFYKLKDNYHPKIQGQDSWKLEEFFVVYNLTPREKELTFLLLEGKTNQEITEKLFISLQTVKNYVSTIYKKIGLKNRVQFVNFVRNNIDENSWSNSSSED